MILDTLVLMSDDQSLAQAIGTYLSDVVPFTVDGYETSADAPDGVGGDPAKGCGLDLYCAINETVTSGGAATLQVLLETSDTEAFDETTVLAQSPVYALADLVAGKRLLPQFVPWGVKKYLRTKYIIGTAAITGGVVTSGITAANQSN